MLYALITLGSLGILFGFGLFIASRVFYVKIDPRVEKVGCVLPGANCGGCGFPGCAGLSEAIVRGSAAADSCPVANEEQNKEIAGIMGVELSAQDRQVAVLHCHGKNVADRFTYDGPQTCAAAALIAGGQKGCSYGCLGLADCLRCCAFGAIKMVDGLPQIDEEKCTACGKCVDACPRALIALHSLKKDHVHVLCRSLDKAPQVKQVCDVGCIGCKLCEKNCKFDAIKVTNFLAEIDYEKCTSCGACVKSCPTNCIANFRFQRRARAKAKKEEK